MIINRNTIRKLYRFTLAVFLCGTVWTSFAQEILFSATPTVSIPLSPAEIYNLQAGGALNIRVDPIFGNVEGNARLGYSSLIITGGLGTVSLVKAEAGGMKPIVKTPSFTLGPYFLAGGYGAFKEGSPSLFNPMFEGGFRAEFKLNNLRLGIEPGMEYLVAKENGSIGSFLTSAGVSVSIAFVPGGTGHRALLKITAPKLDPVFPVIYKSYTNLPVGMTNIENKERSAITNVDVTFFVPAYMDGPQTIASVPSVKPGEGIQVPINVLFKNSVLGITETDTAQAQVNVKYSIGKETYTVGWDGTMNIQGRNAIIWSDDRIAAAFVTAKDPTILKLSRNTIASIPKNGLSVPSEAFRKAAILFQSLESFGLKYVVDPKGSYATMKGASESVDYLQFPIETLTYRTGDCDDLSTLYLAMLESVGIETAFITVPGHIYTAFALDVSTQGAKAIFSNLDSLIFANDKIWVPIETTVIGNGFAEAWALGARQWREAERQKVAALVSVHDAWQMYEPSFISSGEKQDVVARFPDPAIVSESYLKAMNSTATREMNALVASLSAGQAFAKLSPLSKNRVGSVYARYGMMDKAETAFKDAAALKYPPALINLGNIRFLRKDFPAAADLYRQALDSQPANADAALGLSRALFEGGKYEDAAKAFKEVKTLAPEKTTGFAYLSGGSDQASGRAVDAAARATVDWAY